MKILDLLEMGFKNLWRRKARTFLTILGVVIGTASIVIMFSLGIGMNETFKQQLKSMGSLNIITVSTDRYGGYYIGEEEDESKYDENAVLDDQVVSDIRQIDSVTAVMPILRLNGQISAGRYQGWGDINGIDPDEMENFGFSVQEGRLLKNTDINGIVFGAEVDKNFYDPRSRGGYESIEIDLLKTRLYFKMGYGSDNKRGEKLSPVGILEKSNGRKDWSSYMSIATVKKLKEKKERQERENSGNRRRRDEEKSGYDELQVKVDDISKIQEIQTAIEEYGFRASSLQDILENMKETTKMIRYILAGIGAVSLVVAAIGITNTMVMSIYERTREIGVMKVLGARLKDIKRLFLFEAAMIGLLGGILGLGVSFGVSHLMNSMGTNLMGYGGAPDSQMSIIPVWLAFASLGFSTVIGVISGFYPARRAMKLSVLEAIRTE